MSTSSAAVAGSTAPAWMIWVRRVYLLVGALAGAAIVGQVFLAGVAVLADPTYWAAHRSFGNAIELVGLVLVLVGFATRLPWRVQAWGWLLYVLTFMQYVFLYLMPMMGVPLLRGLHAANALTLFGAAVVLVIKTWQARNG